MESINTLRAVLVGGAVLAAFFAVLQGAWVAAAVLGAGIAAHAAMWVHLHRHGALVPPQHDADR